MKQTTYNKFSGLVFAVVAVAHAVRAYNNWTITVGTFELPVWVSWVAVALLAYLAYQSLKAR
jgi:hypothetical protein